MNLAPQSEACRAADVSARTNPPSGTTTDLAACDGQGGPAGHGRVFPAADFELAGFYALTWEGATQTLVISSEQGEVGRIRHPNAFALIDNLRGHHSQAARVIYLDGILHCLQLMDGSGFIPEEEETTA